jgi:hypothetical protein
LLGGVTLAVALGTIVGNLPTFVDVLAFQFRDVSNIVLPLPDALAGLVGGRFPPRGTVSGFREAANALQPR